ncbi:ribosome maturation factor RimM [Accumulibacter sp.]|uniref:ribosome maturation factor RimM n=1 Tax=Accumulibacter sp. TaxID=2053492 RepID=UPI00260DF15D|nr:ribosome maturation factor RimM [Accumulibacter sp.]
MTENEAPPADIVVLGKIAAPYGLRGAVRVYPFADDPAAWSKLSHWWLGREADAPALWHRTRLLKCKQHNDLLIADLACLADRTAAEAHTGMLVGTPRAELPPTEPDEYYWADLVGLAVINSRDLSLGHILGLIETPANTVLRVGDGQSAERLLPFVAAVVLDVDLPRRRVRVDWEMDW